MTAFIALLLLPLVAPAQETLSEEWYTLELNGVRAGYIHSSRTKHVKKSGAVEIETVEEMRLSMKRMGTGIDIKNVTRSFETPGGKALRFSSLAVMAAQPTTTDGRIEDGKLTLKTVTAGVEHEYSLDWDPDWILAEGMRLLTLRKGFKEGTRYTFKTFDSERRAEDIATVEVGAKEPREIQGRKIELTPVSYGSKLNPGLKVVTWVDAKGKAHVTEISIIGMEIKAVLATRKAALEDAPSDPPEVFFGLMPRSNVMLPRPRRITALTLELEHPDDVFEKWSPPGGTQVVRARKGRRMTLRITAAAPDKSPSLPIQAKGDLAKFLEPSPHVQCRDPGIVEKAKEIAGAEKDSLKAAQALAGWVYTHIKKKSMSVGYASAKEVLNRAEGDCTEHAVLLAAMLRARGIPAKQCLGFLYFRGAWGGHAWVSAWVGRWVDLDATLGGELADAARLKFSETELSPTGGLTEHGSGATFMHGGMKISVSEYTIEGTPVKVSEVGDGVDGHLFRSKPLGISFKKPEEGWRFASEEDRSLFALTSLRSNEGEAEIRVGYIDLGYDQADVPLRLLVRRLGSPTRGKKDEIAGLPARDCGSAIYVRLSKGEVLVFRLKGEELAREGFKAIRASLTVSR